MFLSVWMIIQLSQAPAPSAPLCDFKIVSPIEGTLKVKTATTDINILAEDAKLDKCEWLQAGISILVELDLGTSGTTSDRHEKHLYIYKLAKKKDGQQLTLQYQQLLLKEMNRRENGKLKSSKQEFPYKIEKHGKKISIINVKTKEKSPLP